jgi:hypothetical protein
LESAKLPRGSGGGKNSVFARHEHHLLKRAKIHGIRGRAKKKNEAALHVSYEYRNLHERSMLGMIFVLPGNYQLPSFHSPTFVQSIKNYSAFYSFNKAMSQEEQNASLLLISD